MPRRLIITLGIGGRFPLGVARMVAGARANGYDGEIWALTDYPEGCPTHKEIPYGFKPHLVVQAMDAGFDQVLWMDAACVPVRSLVRLWYEIERDGCALPLSHLSIGEWCADSALAPLGVMREQVMAMKPSIWACVMGFDFRNPLTREFVRRWHGLSLDGVTFHGAWTNEIMQASKNRRVKGHRHDQTAATVLAYQMGLPFNINVVEYDSINIMPVAGYERFLRLPWCRTPIISNHNVK